MLNIIAAILAFCSGVFLSVIAVEMILDRFWAIAPLMLLVAASLFALAIVNVYMAVI